MKSMRILLTLTAINLVLLGLNLVWMGRASEASPDGVLRGSGMELVDGAGKVRSSIRMEGDGVVLRLMDAQGTIRVKLGAGRDGSGLMLADEATEPGVQLLARRKAAPERPSTRILLRGGSGQERVITP